MKIGGMGDLDVSVVWQCDDRRRLTDEVDKLAQRIAKIRRIS